MGSLEREAVLLKNFLKFCAHSDTFTCFKHEWAMDCQIPLQLTLDVKAVAEGSGARAQHRVGCCGCISDSGNTIVDQILQGLRSPERCIPETSDDRNTMLSRPHPTLTSDARRLIEMPHLSTAHFRDVIADLTRLGVALGEV